MVEGQDKGESKSWFVSVSSVFKLNHTVYATLYMWKPEALVRTIKIILPVLHDTLIQ